VDEASAASGVLFLAAFVYALIAQGAFYAVQLSVLEGLVILAFIIGLPACPLTVADLRHAATTAFAIVLTTTLVTAAIDRNLLPALLLDLFLGTLLAAVLLARRLSRNAKEAVVSGILATASGVSIYGWSGVAFRWQPAALLNGPLWRASTSITYANGGACVLMMCALVALARAARGDRWAKLAAYALLVGFGATFSRGGAIAFMVGLVVVAVATGVRRFVKETVPSFVAAAFALTALLPSVPFSSRPHPSVALAGLVIGATVVVAAPRIGTGKTVIAVVSISVVALAILHSEIAPALHRIVSARFADDPAAQGRISRWKDFIKTFRSDPIFGAGPGSFLLHYPGRGTLDVGRFAHNEYLQVLTEQGAAGAAGLLAALFVLARGLWNERREDWLTAGAAAAAVGFVIHGAFDFVWNVPVVPLLAAGFFGMAERRTLRDIEIDDRLAC